jgi:enamine deaminase RidA (YjgF/YER057c/UK114 family)
MPFRLFVVFAMLSVPGLAAAQPLQRVNPEGLSTPQTYSHVVRVGKLLFVAGQVAADASGKPVGDSMRDQLDRVLANLRTALASQGANFGHVAKITIFVTSIEEFLAPEVREVRAKHFGEHRPASTLVQVVKLANPAYRVEVEAIAALP